MSSLVAGPFTAELRVRLTPGLQVSARASVAAAVSVVVAQLLQLVLIDHGSDAWLYSAHRLIETGLGIGIAVLVSFVPKLIRVEDRVS